MNNIENLLERYFEGNTSAEEEAEIRCFFTTGNIPEHLTMYTPLFTYFENEIKKAKSDYKNGDHYSNKEFRLNETTDACTANTKDTDKNRNTILLYKHRNRVKRLSSAIACAALLTGIFFMAPKPERCPKEGNYVIIDGRCYTDMKTIRSTALKTLREVSNDSGEFSDRDALKMNKVIESQLKEFDFLLNE